MSQSHDDHLIQALQISRDLLATPGYNATLNQLVMWLLVITPV